MNIAIRILVSLACAVSASACDPGAESPDKPSAAVAEAQAQAQAQAELDSDAPTASITGSVSYRERMALGPNAELNIRLEDVSLADAPATLIAERNTAIEGQVPIRFELPYDPALIRERNSYTVRATIKDSGRLLFTSDTHNPVLTRGGTDTVDIVLVRAGLSAPAQAALTNTDWLLTAIGGETVSIQESAQVPYLRLTTEGNIAQGFSGCNRYSGAWELDDEGFSLGPFAMTMMACIDENSIEDEFMPALEKSNRYKIERQELILFLDATELLRFKSDN